MRYVNRQSLILSGVLIHLMVLLVLPTLSRAENAQVNGSDVKVSQVTQSLLAMRLPKDVSIDDAVTAMTSKATELNLKLVGRQQVSKELSNRGMKVPHLEVLQYCDPVDAAKVVAKSFIYAAYIPCQITIAEDKQGSAWLLMRNMDMIIDNEMVSADLAEIAIRINQAMLVVMTAGATGEF